MEGRLICLFEQEEEKRGQSGGERAVEFLDRVDMVDGGQDVVEWPRDLGAHRKLWQHTARAEPGETGEPGWSWLSHHQEGTMGRPLSTLSPVGAQ